MSRHLVQLAGSCQTKCEFTLTNVNAIYPKPSYSLMSMPSTPRHPHPIPGTAVLPGYIQFPAANHSTSILFHLALDRRLNKTSDSNILLMMFMGHPLTDVHPWYLWDQTGDLIPAPSLQGVHNPARHCIPHSTLHMFTKAGAQPGSQGASELLSAAWACF